MELSQLKSIGLTDGESKVYIELLKLGEATKTPLARNSRVSSSKIYEVLDRLMEKGLVSYVIKNNVKYFQAAPPEKLVDYMNRKRKDIEKEELVIKELLPQLNSLFNRKAKGISVKIYDGLEGLKTIVEEMLQTAEKGDEYLAMGIVSKKDERFNRMWIRWHKKRNDLGLTTRLIFSESEKSDFFRDLEKIPKTKIRRITMFTPSALQIFRNKTMVSDYKNGVFIVIENEDITQSFREVFESTWKLAK